MNKINQPVATPSPQFGALLAFASPCCQLLSTRIAHFFCPSPLDAPRPFHKIAYNKIENRIQTSAQTSFNTRYSKCSLSTNPAMRMSHPVPAIQVRSKQFGLSPATRRLINQLTINGLVYPTQIKHLVIQSSVNCEGNPDGAAN